MKKNGFVLVETLIATTLIATVFTIIYLEFGTIYDNYKKTYNNNTVEKLYATNNIKNFILGNGYESINTTTSYIDITNCSSFTNQSQCTNLMNVLEVKQVIFLKDDITNIKESLISDNSLSDNFKKFISNLNYDTVVDGFRLIVEYNDGQCASIRM